MSNILTKCQTLAWSTHDRVKFPHDRVKFPHDRVKFSHDRVKFPNDRVKFRFRFCVISCSQWCPVQFILRGLQELYCDMQPYEWSL